jgi:8-oxo-dGTP pyrophosphatase MutT (NUDIX family)
VLQTVSRFGWVARVDRPPPGEELNTGATTTPRLAATAMVVRDGNDGLEVLLVQRNPEQRFMGGAWVFPGGAVHDDDADPPAAALRELEEEAGLRIEDVDALVPFSRWITPVEVKIRFDTFFYLAAAPRGAEPRVDGSECVDSRWIRPADALEAGRRGELMLVFPTIRHLEQLTGLESVEQALADARSREVEPILPKVATVDGEAHVLLPGEPGYPS